MTRLVLTAAFAIGVGLSALSDVSAEAAPFGAKPPASSPVGNVSPGTGKPTLNPQPPGSSDDPAADDDPADDDSSGSPIRPRGHQPRQQKTASATPMWIHVVASCSGSDQHQSAKGGQLDTGADATWDFSGTLEPDDDQPPLNLKQPYLVLPKEGAAFWGRIQGRASHRVSSVVSAAGLNAGGTEKASGPFEGMFRLELVRITTWFPGLGAKGKAATYAEPAVEIRMRMTEGVYASAGQSRRTASGMRASVKQDVVSVPNFVVGAPVTAAFLYSQGPGLALIRGGLPLPFKFDGGCITLSGRHLLSGSLEMAYGPFAPKQR